MVGGQGEEVEVGESAGAEDAGGVEHRWVAERYVVGPDFVVGAADEIGELRLRDLAQKES